MTFWEVRPLREPSDSIFFTTDSPSVTLPNTTARHAGAPERSAAG